MGETIKVNTDSLEVQVKAINEALYELRRNQTASNLYSKLTVSSGSSVDSLKAINDSLVKVSTSLEKLFQLTLDFFNNTSASFVETDNIIGEQISKNKE